MSHAKETGTRKGWSGEDDIIARFGSKHEYFLASDPSYPKLVASYGILGRSEQYTSRKKSYARPALALFWQLVLQANRRDPRHPNSYHLHASTSSQRLIVDSLTIRYRHCKALKKLAQNDS